MPMKHIRNASCHRASGRTTNCAQADMHRRRDGWKQVHARARRKGHKLQKQPGSIVLHAFDVREVWCEWDAVGSRFFHAGEAFEWNRQIRLAAPRWVLGVPGGSSL